MGKGNSFKRPYNSSVPQSKKAMQEFAAHKGIVVCNGCGAAYFEKRWVHGLEELKNKEGKDTPVSFALCPACTMIKNKQYEGRITVRNLPEKHVKDLDDVVRGFSRRATERDPMDRLIAIAKNGDNWVITTTENEMANKLAHHIKESLRASKSRTKFAGDPSDVVEITIDFSE